MKATPPAGSPAAGQGLHSIETASRDELETLQLARLRWSVAHAYEQVEHYRGAFDRAGCHPADIQCLADLADFPFLTKSHFRDHYPFGLFAVPMDRISRIHASSGTTGRPTVVGYTRQDLDTWAELVARSIYAAGGRPGDRIHVAYGYGLFTGGLGAHYGAERLGCTVIPMSGGQTEKQVQLILDFQPQVIMATPSYTLTLVEEFVRRGIDPQSSSLKIGICGAEPWTEALRREIELRLGIDALDIYGLSEVIGPGVAAECIETKDGLCIWEDHFYPEVIDPQTGKTLPDGEEGELVLTSLSKQALPVIRYRTGDRCHLAPPTARAMRRLSRISGRTDDMMIVRGVNVFPTQIEELIFRQGVFGSAYLIELHRVGHLDAVRVHVEWSAEARPALTRDEAARTLCREIKSTVGITVEVEVLDAGTLERSAGKARRVIDRRHS